MDLHTFYSTVREQTVALVHNLSPEDMVVQSMPDASPAKWHLAHTTWFFEEFVLSKYCLDYRPFDESFCYLFNSYYDSVGERHPRAQRGLLTRPPVSAVLDYRAYVDRHMSELVRVKPEGPVAELVITGLHHEMQHQELLLTDILHAFSCNALNPAVFVAEVGQATSLPTAIEWLEYPGGLMHIGADEQGFSYDCERPRHRVFLQAFALANRPVTNREWLEFMAAGGYEDPLLWLADGWAARQRNGWHTPLYWRKSGRQWLQFGLDGLQPLSLDAPVCHISYYEADAFARWAGKRLPTEQEWEHAAAQSGLEGAFLEAGLWRPRAAMQARGQHLQLCGTVWHWTQSPYTGYPGFRPEGGALQEYNGKFMANQFVLRGGSCVTPKAQMRTSYRNFFYPDQRWQFSGLRLAESR